MNAPVDVVGRVHEVLKALAAHEPDGVRTSDLARATGIARPTAHRLLSTLARVGLADRDAATERWLLGPELHFLGAAAASRYDVTQIAQPFVRRLADATDESAFFSARRGDETICLIREDGAFPLRSHVLHEGARFPLGVVSAGMVILAHLSDREVDDYLVGADLSTGYGPQHGRDRVREHIAATRRRGYSVNPGLVVQGSWGMAAAVFDREGNPSGALSLTGVEHRFHAERRPELGALLMRQAHELTKALAAPRRRDAAGR
ncbi:IclR family transcriptional regulator [Nocardioides daejeonensis]|uniref:IclR family transcriptional regulator n=1 Tax=Nocardioides daejeonensis TaxID=1046556 RepID=UPI000D74DE99|nr:IclR family transcriptional regulator [Nocardioides daejeonensis]